MSGWHSLSGYLNFKPGGAFLKFKTKKRLWYVFEEKTCELYYYKSYEDAKSKEPLGTVDIKAAAIQLCLNETNQFTILSRGKEHIFIADNHESMMIWVVGLQAKRDGYAAKGLQSKQNEKRKTHSESGTGMRQGSLRRNSLFSKWDFRQQQRLLRRLGESVDGGLDVMFHESDLKKNNPLAKSLESALDRVPFRSHDIDVNSTGPNSPANTIDDVFFVNEQICQSSPLTPLEKSRLLKKVKSDLSENNMSALFGDKDERHESLSGQSAASTSDSALDRNSEHEIVTRLAEMEQELMSTKCELAKKLNQEACYKAILEKRDSVIIELDEQIEKLQEMKEDKQSMDKRMKEQIRILQNQNRFLNEEVKKMAQARQNDWDKFSEQDSHIKELEATIEQWKRDYVFLLQSCVKVPTGDLMDGLEVNLFGGTRHRERLQELLEEARETNPGLPTYERLSKSDVHVDSYGFKHSYHTHEGLLLHYLGQQLHQYYHTKVSGYEEHQRKWKQTLTKSKTCLRKTKELKALCRRGIPSQYRTEVWKYLVFNQVRDLIDEKGPHYYSNLCNSVHDSEFAGCYKKQISVDLLRSMPNNINFNSPTADGIRKMQEVLQAFCIHNPDVGYCQGMNFVVGMCLLFLDTEDAFWALIAITEVYFAANYFDQNLSGAQADQEVLKELLQEKLPALHKHLDNLDIEIATVTLNWCLAVFFDAVPFETLLRIWDCFLLEGPKVLFRFAVAILKTHEASLLQKHDTISVMRHLKACAKLTYDAEGLIKTAFEDLKPFPRRQDIAAKQVVYLNTLKEKLKKKELQKQVFVEQEQMLRELELLPVRALVFECAVSYGEGLLWVCYGEQNVGKVCLVNCTEGLIFDIGIELDSRIMCMCCKNGDVLFLGTLSWHVVAFNTKTREEMWMLQLHDTVLSMCCHLLEDGCARIFAGLADGTVAVLEYENTEEPSDDPIYIPIGHSPITSMVLIGNQLWLACGSYVYIHHAENLDAMDRFTVSSNPLDHILTMQWGKHGVWITVKGSSVLELWDPKNLTCNLFFDVKTNKPATLRKDESSFLNKSRITAMLPLEDSVWIGTGDGTLMIFDILYSNFNQITVPSNKPTHKGKSKHRKHIRRNDSLDSLEVKIHELYLERMHQEFETLTRENEMKEMKGNCGKTEEGENGNVVENGIYNCDVNGENKEYNQNKNIVNEKEGNENGDQSNEKNVNMENCFNGYSDAMASTQSVDNEKEKKGILQNRDENGESEKDESVSLGNNVSSSLTNGEPESSSLSENHLNKSTDTPEDSQDEILNGSGLEDDEVAETLAKMNDDMEQSGTEKMRDSGIDCEMFGMPTSQMPIPVIGIEGPVGELKNEENSVDGRIEDEKLGEDSVLSQVLKRVHEKRSLPPEESLVTGESVTIPKESFLNSLSPISESYEILQASPEVESKQMPQSKDQKRPNASELTLSVDSNMTGAELLFLRLSPISEGAESAGGYSSPGYHSENTPKYLSESGDSPTKSCKNNANLSHTPVSSPSVQRKSHGTSESGDWSSYDEIHISPGKESETKPKKTSSKAKTKPKHSRKKIKKPRQAGDDDSNCELSLQAKIKILDKPIRCLVQTRVNQEMTIVSCSGCFGDDEAVLKWKKELDEQLWTNEPLYEVCPYTNIPKAPLYLRSRINSIPQSDSKDELKNFFTKPTKYAVPL